MGPVPVNLPLAFAGAALLTPLFLSRLLLLASGRFGWLMYLANVLWETLSKRSGLGRPLLEAASAVGGLMALASSGLRPEGIAGVALALAVAELANRYSERRILTEVYCSFDERGVLASGTGRSEGAVFGWPAPSASPELTLTLLGPFVGRLPVYRIGIVAAGVPFDVELVVGNHTEFPTQTPVEVELEVPAGWKMSEPACRSFPPAAPGTVARARWRVLPFAPCAAGALEIRASWDRTCQSLVIRHDGCRDLTGERIEGAVICRYPGARRAAFAWRGDMDLYDRSSAQSIEGLEESLGLAARYCFPQTIFLSTRLSLDESAAREWSEHYGVDRGAAEIPRFIRWMKEAVELRHSGAYPVESEKRYFAELGNHGHLHYGTDTSAAPENGWKTKAHMGAGRYSWMGSDGSSFAEQRDNALEASSWCRRLLDFTPRSWAKPGRCNDLATAAAVEAAGCEVLSGSDIRSIDNVLLHPMPHHPGQTTAVELTTRYPGDPRQVQQVAMLLFWLHRSWRRGIPMIYMCHQHLRRFEGRACARFTEYLLRYVLTRFHGDLHVDTVFGVGKYWREVLSPKTRRVSVNVSGTELTVVNESDMDLVHAPVDLAFSGGARSTVLISVPAGGSVTTSLEPVRELRPVESTAPPLGSSTRAEA